MSKSTVISNESAANIVLTNANIPGVATPVFTVTVPDGATYTLPNVTTVSGAVLSGAVLVVDLRNADGDRIRAGSLLVGYRAPSAEFVTFVRAVSLATWADLSTQQQKSAQYRGTLAQATDLNVGPYLTVQKRAKLVFAVDSPEIVDWDNSYLEFVVEEVNG